MGTNCIGEVIRSLRKQKGITQEELAQHTGVSTQAVSKWECGGLPDTELIPSIADFFGVSIDTLFGRTLTDYTDLEAAILSKLSDIDDSERMKYAFELCWIIQQGLGGTSVVDKNFSLDKIRSMEDNPVYSRMIKDSGIALMGLKEQLPYFFLMPASDDRRDTLLKDIDYLNLFSLLSDKETFGALIFLYTRENKAFTPKLLVKNLNISPDKSLDILSKLTQYNLISTSEIELDDEIQQVYSFRASPAFVPLLTLAKEVIIPPNKFYWHCEYVNLPYLK